MLAIKNKGLVPILKNNDFKLVHPVDVGNWLKEGWQKIEVLETSFDDFTRYIESLYDELEGLGAPLNPPPNLQKSYNYWDTSNDVLYRWDIADRQWVVLAATQNSHMTPVEIRDSLSSLGGNLRLDSGAIKNLPRPYDPPIPISDVTNLQNNLDSKAPIVHAHAIADISSLSEALNNKANALHAHAIADVENLQNALNSKALLVHNHNASDISDLGSVLSGYAPISHSHAIANIIGLQGELDAISSSAFSGNYADLTDKPTIADIPGVGSASTFNAPTSGNANNTEVVLGSDTRLSDARTPTTHDHTVIEIAGLGTSATLDVPGAPGTNANSDQIVRGDDPRLVNGRSPTGAAGGNLSGSYPNPGIADDAVTYAKLQNILGSRLLGNPTGSTANASEISLAVNSGLVFSGSALGVSGWTSYTPTLRGSTIAGSFTYARQIGRFVRFNNVCFVVGRVAISAITTAPTGNIQIVLPVAAAASLPTGFMVPATVLNNNATANAALNASIALTASSSNALLYKIIDGVLSVVTPDEIGTNFDLCFNISYIL